MLAFNLGRHARDRDGVQENADVDTSERSSKE